MQTVEISNSAEHQLDELETQKARLEDKIEQLVTRLRAGALDASGVDELRAFSDDVARLNRRISAAEERVEIERMRRTAIAAQEGRVEFDAALKTAQLARAEFLELYRRTCLALGGYCTAVNAANASAPQVNTAFGLLPQDQTALRALPLSDAPARSLDGLHGFTDSHWKTAFQILPMKTEK
jgi:hypothetical protein